MFANVRLRYKWYIILRLIIVISILGTGIVTLTRGFNLNFFPLIVIIFMTLLMNIIFLIILRTGKFRELYLYIQLIFDNLLIFAIIYYTGGRDSVFTMLYFINILSGTFFLFLRGGILLAVMSTAGYSLMILGDYFGFLFSPYDVNVGTDIMLENALMRIFINALGYSFFAAIGGYLSERLAQQRMSFRTRLRDIIDNIQSAIIVIDNDYRVDDFNETAAKWFGSIHIDSEINHLPPVIAENIDKNYIRFEKEGRTYDMRTQHIKRKKENSIILIINDITQLIKYEETLLEKERLSAIGQLSASIAHEIRNPLSSIKGSVGIMSEELPARFREHPMLKITLEEIERLNSMINDFLAYARISTVNIEDVNLTDLIVNTVTLLNMHEITQINIPDGTYIKTDSGKLKQVIINILKNAHYAVRHTHNKHISIVYGQNDMYNSISISDNGEGIDERIREKMFEPFNSAKPSGTGLGLAIVYRIVKDELGGDIRFSSEPGHTEFEIMLRRNNE